MAQLTVSNTTTNRISMGTYIGTLSSGQTKTLDLTINEIEYVLPTLVAAAKAGTIIWSTSPSAETADDAAFSSIGGGSLETKAGSVLAADFTGDPGQSPVVFETPFASKPSVFTTAEILGGAERYNVNTFNISTEGFTIDITPGDVANLLAVNWTASEIGEGASTSEEVVVVVTPPVVPTITGTVPVGAATDVAANSTIQATFSAAMNPATISAATFTVAVGGVDIAGTVTYSGLTATFTPTADMVLGTVHTATISTGAQSALGVALASATNWSFTSVAAVIGVPTVDSVSPASAGTDIAIGALITATFSEAMDPATIDGTTFTVEVGGVAVAGAVTYAGLVATFTPTTDLGFDDVHDVTITTGAQSASSNTAIAVDYTWSFTSTSEITSLDSFFLGHSLLGFEVPNVVQRFADGLPDVALNRDVGIGIGASLQFQFNNPLTTGGDNASVFLQAGPYDVLVLTEAVPIENQIDGAASVANALNFANLALAENPSVQVYLYETWEDRTVAGGWESSIDERRTYYERIKAGFDSGFAGADLRIIPGGQAVRALSDAATAGNVSGLPDPDALFIVEGGADIHPTDLLIYFLGCVHFATLFGRTPVGLPSSLLDRFGTVYASVPTAAMAADMQAIAWAAVQAEPYSGVDAVVGVPTFDSMSPASMSIGADVDGDILVTFSETMNAATLFSPQLLLSVGGVAVATTISNAGLVATINPTASLIGDTLYTVTATTDIQSDGSGTNMTANRAFSFTTEEAAVPPELNTTAPVENAVGAARFAGISVFYFSDIDPATVNGTTFVVTLTSDDSVVPGTLSVTGGGISFSPTTPLASLAEHRVQLTAGISGVAPLGAIVPLDYTFTTSA